jgi:hypothetical protein
LQGERFIQRDAWRWLRSENSIFANGYVVVKRLPKHDGEFEYQKKTITESDERVAG